MSSPKTDGFSATVTLKAGDWSANGAIERSGLGQLTLTCSEPPALSGLCVTLNGERATLSKNGLSTELSLAELPQGALFLELCRVLDDAAHHTPVTDGDRVEGVCQNSPYTLRFDPKTGALSELTVPDRSLSVRFFDFCAKTVDDFG